MKTVHIIVSMGLLASLFACEGIERTVDEMASVPTTDLPFITSFICPQDSVVRVRVERTTPVVGSVPGNSFPGQAISGATVVIADGTQSTTLVQGDFDRVYQTRPHSFTVLAGHTYQLTIQLPNGNKISSQCTVPSAAVPAPGIQGIKDPASGRVRFSWPNLPGSGHYYASYYYTYRVYYGVPSGNTAGPQEIFTDKKDLKAGVFFTKPIDVTTLPYETNAFIICHTDKLYYDYQHTIDALTIAKDNPFADPVRLPSNITGAYGVFCGYNRTVVAYK
jgi:Domain of unknown function (DUF4249)